MTNIDRNAYVVALNRERALLDLATTGAPVIDSEPAEFNPRRYRVLLAQKTKKPPEGSAAEEAGESAAEESSEPPDEDAAAKNKIHAAHAQAHSGNLKAARGLAASASADLPGKHPAQPHLINAHMSSNRPEFLKHIKKAANC